MSAMKILVPTVIPIDLDAVDGVERIDYDVEAPIPAEHRDAEAIVLWLNPGERLRSLPSELPELRWVQGLMAGTDAVHAAGFGPQVVITAGVGLHDQPVAEHALAMVLAAARRLDETIRAQADGEWLSAHSGNQTVNRGGFTTLAGARVVIWGFGGIGQTLAAYLSVLGAEVIGIARHAGERAGYRVVTPSDLPALLPTTDVLVDILPGTAKTDGVVGAEVFAALPEHAWFVNVGRGVTVDEDALLEALSSGAIGGAALDVFRTEPLPAESPLWRAPNVILTPHSAGGRPQEPGRLIAANLRRYRAGEELIGVSDG